MSTHQTIWPIDTPVIEIVYCALSRACACADRPHAATIRQANAPDTPVAARRYGEKVEIMTSAIGRLARTRITTNTTLVVLHQNNGVHCLKRCLLYTSDAADE